MRSRRRWSLLIGVAVLTWPGLGLAQEPVGVVTGLSGQATRTASAALAVPTPLRFKDGLFGTDTIRTAERSFVRVLLERKAVLTVRELSRLRIADRATRAAVDLQSGGIAFSVARPRLGPGETLEVDTPNAVAAVRGASIVVEAQGAVTHFHVLSGTLDVASRANPTAWRRLQAPASLSVTGAAVGPVRALDDDTRDRLSAGYLALRVAELSAPAEVVAQEQAKAVLLARLISGDGAEGDEIEMLAVADGPVTPTAPGMQTPTQAPVAPTVVPPVAPGAPAPIPVAPPLWSFTNQVVARPGDLHNVPGGSVDSLASGLAGAAGSTVTVANEVVDVTGTLTATAATPFISLQASTLTSRGLVQVQTGSLSLTAGPLLQAIGGGVSTDNDLLRVASGGHLVGSAWPLLSLTGTSLGVGNGTGDRLLELTGAGSQVSLGGSLLAATGSIVSLAADDLLNISGGGRLVGTGTSALVRFTNSTLDVGNGGGDQLFQVTGAGSAATVAGGLLDASSTAVTLTGSALVDVSSGAVLTATGAGPLASLSGGSLGLGGAAGFAVSSTAASQVAGTLLRTAGTDVSTTGNLVSVSGSLTGTGSAALLDLTGGTVSAGGGVVVSTGNGRLTLGGPALTRSGGSLATTNDLFNVSGGARLVAAGTGALLGFSNTTVNVGNGGDQLFQLTGAGSAATLAGSVLDAAGSTLTLPSGSLVEVSSGAVLTATGAGPLASLSGGALDLGGATGFLISSTGPSTIGGSLLRSAGADVLTTGNLVTVSGSLTGTGGVALLETGGGTVSARNAIVISSANGRLTLNGPALDRAGGLLTTSDDLVSVGAGARLTGLGTGPLLAFSNSTVSIGNASGDQLFVVSGAGAAASLAGPMLGATGTNLSLTGTALVEVSGGAALTGTAAQPLVDLSGGALTLGPAASGFRLNTAGTATLAGGLLDAAGTDITAAGDFVRVLGGARVNVAGSAPVLSLTGGTHQFGAAGNIYRLSGTATAVDPVTGLTLGTEEPIQAAGPLFEAVGATAATQRAVRLDVALLQASAPLLSLRANGAVASQLTTSSNAIDLTSRARLNATAPVIALDGSRLIVTNASLVNVAGGSYLGVTGNLLSVANGSQLTVNGGLLLFARAGSVVEISGALLSFGGTGSTVTVSNTLCPCTTIGGIPVRLSGGALAANVSITNPIHSAAGNTLSIPAGAAAIRVDGATTRVTIGGQ